MNVPDTPLAPRLFDRLPEILRLRDTEQVPPGQLQALVDAIDSVFSALRDRVEAQYDDLFIETCAPWVVPYIADLVGTSHLKGDPRTLRADVARTVYHRRRKGTPGAVESQVHALSGWAVHAVELRDRLGWMQHLNHLRPDKGGTPPWQTTPDADPRHPVRGGTAALRAPGWLSLVDGPFDPCARTADLRPPPLGAPDGPARAAPNLPNLGVFLWRLADYQVPVAMPARREVVLSLLPGSAPFAVRFDLHPCGEPMQLFNTHRYRADDEPPDLADADAVPHPMPRARLTTGAPAGRPEAYVQVLPYAGTHPPEPADDAPGLVLHVPAVPFAGTPWTFRGANLCAWESGLVPPLRLHEIAIDPATGRMVAGVGGALPGDAAEPLADGLWVSATHGFSGPVGAQPVPHPPPPELQAGPVLRIHIADGPDVLAAALAGLGSRTEPLQVEIADSGTHVLDLAAIAGIGVDAGGFHLRLAMPLSIRAVDGASPTVRLVRPLRLRPAAITADASAQAQAEVLFQGLTLTRAPGFPAGAALVEQAALNRLVFDGCTLDPGGGRVLDGSAAGGRAPLWPALALDDAYGLTDADETRDFAQVPALVLRRCISGALPVGRGYTLALQACIVDAGSGTDAAAPQLAIGTEPGWGPPLAFDGLTVFGRCRVERARGSGGIFVHALQVHDNQDSHGALAAPNTSGTAGSCIRHSWLSGVGDRLPQHVACLFGQGSAGPASAPALLRFTAQQFGAPGYAQLAWSCDARLREAGPGDDEMGAFGFLLNTHRWKNIGIRLREFMPLARRALLVPVT